MRQPLILIFLLFFFPAFAQEKEKPVIEEKLIPLAEWFQNPLTDDFAATLLTQLRDSGVVADGVRQGFWITHFVDASFIGQKMKYVVGDQEYPTTMPATLKKEEGYYVNGNREGVWVLYESAETQPPFHWDTNSVMHYKAGVKHGEEIIFNTLAPNKQTPVMVRVWNNDVMTGGKLYYTEAPYGLKKTHRMENGELLYMRGYYPTGVLQEAFDDTTINGKKVQYLKEFYESGKLKQIGLYENGLRSGTFKAYYESGKIQTMAEYANEERNGSYKVFYESGLLWTERIYKEDKLMEVTVNYNKLGKKQNPGTLKNGNGTLNVYDAEGKLLQTVEFVDGKEKK